MCINGFMRFLFVIVVSNLVLGCDGSSNEEGGVCPTVVEPAFFVQVYDQSTQARIDCQATVTLLTPTSEIVEENLTEYGTCEDLGDSEIGLGWQSGLYDVRVEAEGYEEWYQQDVEVTETGVPCNQPITVHLHIEMVPLTN